MKTMSRFPIYLYLAMRRTYGQGRFVTTVKFGFLSIAYLVNLLLTFIVVAVFTALAM